MEALTKTAIVKGAEKLGIVLKKEQFQAIYQFCLGKDVFVSLPTGYGKSMIYAILPFVFNHIRSRAFKYDAEHVFKIIFTYY